MLNGLQWLRQCKPQKALSTVLVAAGATASSSNPQSHLQPASCSSQSFLLHTLSPVSPTTMVLIRLQFINKLVLWPSGC